MCKVKAFLHNRQIFHNFAVPKAAALATNPMKRLIVKILLCFLLAMVAPLRAGAISFALDSIAQWGKFPRFCVNTYRWGDKFFNSYDSLYVVGPGTKFNVKAVTESWIDTYHFTLPGNQQVDLRSDASTSVGAYVTYLAVSAGYDINISNLFGGVNHARSRYRFGFNCSLLGVEMYWENNDVGTTLRRMGPYKNLKIPFDGVKIGSWGIDVYYFFNHKRYSQAAAFTFGKIQKRSQGSFYAGLSIYSQDYDFDFSGLDSDMRDLLPDDWDDYHYRVKTHNYGFRLGYGYNWVAGRNWVVCGSFSPTVGIRKGYINSDEERTSFSLYQRLKASAVWNHGHWFLGIIGQADISIVSEKQTTFVGANLTASASIGYRFNLW